MGKFSTYRYLELKDDTSSPPISSRNRTSIKHPRRLKKVFIFLIVLALCVTYFLERSVSWSENGKPYRDFSAYFTYINNSDADVLKDGRFGTNLARAMASFLLNLMRLSAGLFAGQSMWLDGLAKSLGYESVYHHAVIIDAGSSGSRVLAYKFRVPFTVFGQANLDLVEEYFEQTKPGLSSYADDPEQGADTIVQLIKKAEYLTPPEKRKSTPLIVRATAGLRLLPAEKAQQLITSVSLAISKLGYDTNTHSVEIMDGSDEGIFIWYTVNLLHNLINGDTMAALDLGGGSTQITYQLTDKDIPQYPIIDQYVVPAGENVTLYTHSYLGLGLLASRYGVFSMEAGGNDTNEFTSVCVEPIIQREPWTYGNKQYYISGAPRPKGMKRKDAFGLCHAAVKQYVMATLDWEPSVAPKGTVAAMSYFYDVAADAGIIDVMKGGTVSASQYQNAAMKACSASNVEQPWACVDLVYVLTLLQDAYKIQAREPVSLFKKVNGHEVSWALGLAYTTVMNKIAAMDH